MANQYIENLLQQYGITDYLEINSQEELIARKNIINTENTICNKLFTQQRLTKYQRAYLIYSIISGFELGIRTNDCDWSDYNVKVNNQFYGKNIALTSGQNKLLILSLMDGNVETISHILNIYQLVYLNDVLQREKWNVNNYESYFREDWQPTYVGIRTQDLSEIMFDFFQNPETRYTHQNMCDYIVLTFRKLYSFNRFLESNKANNVNQLIQLLNIIIRDDLNMNHKFMEFLNILDEDQILMLGM
jgi:hypothetical protein